MALLPVNARVSVSVVFRHVLLSAYTVVQLGLIMILSALQGYGSPLMLSDVLYPPFQDKQHIDNKRSKKQRIASVSSSKPSESSLYPYRMLVFVAVSLCWFSAL